MKAKFILLLCAFTITTVCKANTDLERSEFRIYYYDEYGLVFDEGHGIKEYSSAIKHMHKTISPRAGWERFRALCGKMVSNVTCLKFDEDTNLPGSDYFCANMDAYASDTLKGMDENDINALEDLCEAHKARPVRSIRILSLLN